jgi:zinc protease
MKNKNIARNNPPIDSHLIEFKFPRVYRHNLSNGLPLLIIEHHEIPKVYFRIGYDFGSKDDPSGKAGLNQILSTTIKKGTKNKDYYTIIEKIEELGGELDFVTSEDFYFVQGEFLKEHAEKGLDILRDILQYPIFPQEHLDKERFKQIADLENEKSSPEFLAQRRLDKALFAPHPYGVHKTISSLQSISRKDLVNFHGSFFSSKPALLVVAGDINRNKAINLADKFFGEMPYSPGQDRKPYLLNQTQEHSVNIVNRPESQQVNILMGNLSFKRNHPDYEKLVVMSKILGGGGSGRLFLDLREKKGYTYGAYSSLLAYKEAGAFITNTEVRNEVILAALDSVFEQFEKIKQEPVSEEELQHAKQYLIGVFPLQNETASSIAALSLKQQLYALPDNYWDEYLEKISMVNMDDIQSMAQKYIRSDEMKLVLVGDANFLVDKVGLYGPVSIYDLDDNPVN